MPLDAGPPLVVEGRAARARRDRDAHLAGDRERAEVLEVVGQIAETLAEEERRREGRERFRADALRAAAADIDVEARRENGLARLVLVELIFETRFQVV